MAALTRGSSTRSLLGVLAALALALVGFVAAVPTAPAGADGPADCTLTAQLENPCRPWFGGNSNLYPGITAGSLNQYLYFEQRTGRQMDVAHTFHAVGQTTANQLTDNDRYFINRPNTLLYTNWALTNDFATATGGNDAVNQQIDQMAASIKSVAPAKIFLTLHHEPENDLDVAPSGCSFTPTGTMGTAEEYRAMWANVRARFDAAGVDNVVWVMNYMGYPKYDCTVDALWPGDDLVDWVTYTGYEDSDVGVSFDEEVGTFYDLLTAHSAPGHDYLSKPWGIAEWSIYNTTQESAYLYYRQAREAVEAGRFPRLRMYLVFDNADQTKNLYDYQVSYGKNRTLDPLEQAWFNQYANSWALTGDGTPDPDAPTVPGSTALALDAGERPVLSWDASTDDDGAVTYDVLRDGVRVATTATTRFVDAGVAEGSHFYQVRAVDPTGRAGELSDPLVISAPAPDTTPPSVPTGLGVSLVDHQPSLTWDASSDDRSVTGYDVYRGTTLLATTTETAYVDDTAPAGTATYTVTARDGSDNVSDPSSSVTIEVPDTTPPSAPVLAGTLVGRVPSLSWSASGDDVGVTAYDVYRGTTLLTTTTSLAYDDSAAPTGIQTYTVRARDAAGNVSDASVPVSITVPPPADTTAPTRPTGLRVALAGGVPSLTWNASTDATGVTGYDVLRGGTVIATVTGRQYTDRTAPQGRSSTYTVRARDAAGNVSAVSSSVSIRVPDTTAPVGPGTLSLTRSGTRATLRWSAATDNVAVTAYWVYRGSTRVATLGASARSYAATGLVSGRSYTFRVVARDAAGNQSPGASATG
ncbi:fibronectin type III domain-containing protein [Nocardioides mangrovi]|uniref:Fibronectin type III domain-containing protein n=1 Tax=Nocardioides mangrovi TaxID=2874580 RepID=A0ABS7UAH1_9ACTN|nr:hypothetical protein [Nocardioides mangrovi]MBZ5737834.1 hypothetical protein [Nocardioides mangrovi]